MGHAASENNEGPTLEALRRGLRRYEEERTTEQPE